VDNLIYTWINISVLFFHNDNSKNMWRVFWLNFFILAGADNFFSPINMKFF
jgi:hypothetical protein